MINNDDNDQAKPYRFYLVGGSYDGDIIHFYETIDILKLYKPPRRNNIPVGTRPKLTITPKLIQEYYKRVGEVTEVIGMSRDCFIYAYVGDEHEV